ncbi:MAG: type II toxin-antitoxin system VapC family toxin [Nocardioides sp.]|uniref:type II toxin-antitoxin system VapC family toxin n=1 Tax=Nocardioides sp. TaxID=35761 RepID=UPI0039E6E1D1
MRLLLDTHTYLWARHSPNRLTTSQREAIIDPGNDVLVSAVVVAELAIKSSVGELHGVEPFLADPTAGGTYTDLPLTSGHAALLRELPFHHRDPFDRMLIAQTISEGGTLVTVDQAIAQYDVPVL